MMVITIAHSPKNQCWAFSMVNGEHVEQGDGKTLQDVFEKIDKLVILKYQVITQDNVIKLRSET